MTEQTIENEYSRLEFSSAFMFGNIMNEPERCKRFLEEILGFPIHHVELVNSERTMKFREASHGIRLDIYAEDGKTIYNCEMQTEDEKDLPKRSRYYQGLIDTLKLKPGEDYNLLKKTFIIFICKFDLFGQGRYVYRFESRCEDDYNLKLEDDAIKVFINTKGIVGEVSESFKELIHFMDSSEIKEYKSDLVNDLKNALIEARANEEWRAEYMREIGLENELLRKGRAEGLIEGRAEGLASLVDSLKKFCPDFDTLYQNVVENKTYADVTEDDVKKYYYS